MHRVKAGFWTLMALALTLTATSWMAPAQASSHREAPLITEMPKVDGTDFYMFRSYETGRENYVTFLANYIPIQAPYGGPNFFELDPDARYQINVENDGTDGDDLVFEFQFFEVFKDQQLTVGGVSVAHPLRTVNPISFANNSNDPYIYTVTAIRDGVRSPVLNALTSGIFFAKAFDNAGSKTIADYATYANNLIYPISIPGCAGQGKVFVGQRKESFAVNLGEVFDLVNVPNPIGPRDDKANVLDDSNITTLALEVPIPCLTGVSAVVGGRTTAWLPRTRQLLDDAWRASRPRWRAATWCRSRVSACRWSTRSSSVCATRTSSTPASPRTTWRTSPATSPTRRCPRSSRSSSAPPACRLPTTSRAPTWWRRSSPASRGSTSSAWVRCSASTPRSRPRPQRRRTTSACSAATTPASPTAGVRATTWSTSSCGWRWASSATLSPASTATRRDAPSGLLPFTDQTLQDVSQFDAVFPYLRTPIPGAPNNE